MLPPPSLQPCYKREGGKKKKSHGAAQNVPIYQSSASKRKHELNKKGRDPGGRDGAGVKAEILTQEFWRSEEGQGPRCSAVSEDACAKFWDLQTAGFKRILHKNIKFLSVKSWEEFAVLVQVYLYFIIAFVLV